MNKIIVCVRGLSGYGKRRLHGSGDVSDLSGMCVFGREGGRGQMSLLPGGVDPLLPPMPASLPGKKEYVLLEMWREVESFLRSHSIAAGVAAAGYTKLWKEGI